MLFKVAQFSKVLRQAARAGVVVIALLMASSVNAASYEDGLAAYEDKNYETALKEWIPLAEQGHGGAQYGLGDMYIRGSGVTEDVEQAAKWYTLAAEQGHAEAQYKLGVMYFVGKGVARDDEQAAKWSKLAAEQGVSGAQNVLGKLYNFGAGVTPDYREAIRWYTLAADQGDSDAQDSLKDLQEGKITDWNLEDKKAKSALYDLDESIMTYVTAIVSYSSSGNRNLYFAIQYDNLKCEIAKDSKKPSTSIWHFNNQAVKMNEWCNKSSNSEEHYLQFTPQSYKGSKFVVSAFRKAPSTVSIKTDTLNFKMSAKGFTKVWSSISSEAL